MKTYYAKVAISVSDDVDPNDVFDYVDEAVRSWGELKLIDDASSHLQNCLFKPSSNGSSEQGFRPSIPLEPASLACASYS
jgi:hypothetical protein